MLFRKRFDPFKGKVEHNKDLLDYDDSWTGCFAKTRRQTYEEANLAIAEILNAGKKLYDVRLNLLFNRTLGLGHPDHLMFLACTHAALLFEKHEIDGIAFLLYGEEVLKLEIHILSQNNIDLDESDFKEFWKNRGLKSLEIKKCPSEFSLDDPKELENFLARMDSYLRRSYLLQSNFLSSRESVVFLSAE